MSEQEPAQTPEQEPSTYTEAPYSGNVRVRIRGYDWQLTIRSASNKAFVAKVNGMMDWLDAQTEKFVNPNADDFPIPPADDLPVIGPEVPTGNGKSATAALEIHAVKMEIEPRTDGKVKVKFFAAGHQYPDIDVVRTPEKMAELLRPTSNKWIPDHFKIAREIPIECVIEYRNSEKLNTKGNPYKDVTAIRVAA